MCIQRRAKKPTLRNAWNIDRVRACGIGKQTALVDHLALGDIEGLVAVMWHLRDVSVLARVEQLFKRWKRVI
jgi:hypothetical protein